MNIQALLFGASHTPITFRNKKTNLDEVFDKYTLSVMINWILFSANCTEECFHQAQEIISYKTQDEHFVVTQLTAKFEKWKYDALSIEIVNIV